MDVKAVKRSVFLIGFIITYIENTAEHCLLLTPLMGRLFTDISGNVITAKLHREHFSLSCLHET